MSECFVSWLHGEHNKAAFTESLCGLLAYDAIIRPQEGKPRQIAAMRGFEAGVNIAGPRNDVVRDFLASKEWGDWALSIDVDMTFPPDAVEQLLEHADPERAPIVGGLCFGATGGKLWPTLYELTEEPEFGGPQFVRLPDFPLSNPLLRVSGTGGAFLMVHRRVFEAIEARKFSRAFPWFQETEVPAGSMSEDLTFMLRAGICGFPVHVLTSLHIGHAKLGLLNAYRWFEQEGRIVEPPPDEEGDVTRVTVRPPLPTGSGAAIAGARA